MHTKNEAGVRTHEHDWCFEALCTSLLDKVQTIAVGDIILDSNLQEENAIKCVNTPNPDPRANGSLLTVFAS